METKKMTALSSILTGVLVVLIVLVSVVTYNNKNRINTLNEKNAGLTSTLEERDSLVNELASTFDEIEQNLTFVRNKRGNMVIAGEEGAKNQKEVLVADIKLMNEMLEESSVKIEELEKKLKSSGIEIKSFRNKIAQLNKSIEEQNNSIMQLTAELEQRDYKIAEMDGAIVKLQEDLAVRDDSINSKSQLIAEKAQTIIEKDNELNKAYFAAGTKRQLVEKGVLTQEGGFLGIAKNKSIRDDFNASSFTQLDMRNASQFPINAKKAKLISEHPASSYRLVEENDKIAYLEIEKPEEFWKLTRFVVVETRN
jgi:hypothetical protein